MGLEAIENAAWSYEAPKPDDAAIKDHIAVYSSSTVTVERV